MRHTTHFPILNDLGLSESEALIYELLVEGGTSEARALVKMSGIGRGNVYNILTSLQQAGLVTAIKGSKLQYQATDPSRLRELLEKRLEQARQLESRFQAALPKLMSAYSVSTGRPVVEVFEGYEGVENVLDDTLRSTTEILTYGDVNSLSGKFGEINAKHVKRRIAAGIKKRVLIADTPKAREYFAGRTNTFTSVRFLTRFPEKLATFMELYDDNVSLITISEQRQISVVLQDAGIAALLKAQFEVLWGQAAIVSGETATSSSNAT